MSRGGMYAKMAAVLVLGAIGGPAIMYLVTPEEGELFKRFSPDLQKRNIEMRGEREKNYLELASKMKEYSKSDKPIWIVEQEAAERARSEILRREAQEREEKAKVKAEMRAEAAAGR